MSFNIHTYSEDEQYDLLADIIQGANTHFGNLKNDIFSLQSEEGRMNLLAVRGFKDGSPTKSKITEFDDMTFVIYKEFGLKKVFSMITSTEYGPQGTAYLALCQHQYKIGYHKKGLLSNNQYPDGFVLTDSCAFQTQHYYRAMRPFSTVRILRDTNRNQKQDQGESYEDSSTINIHYGGGGAISQGPGPFSIGCQTIQDWNEYKHFIKLMESDCSIVREGANELAPACAVAGTRPVIYNLIDDQLFLQLLKPKRCFFPIGISNAQEANPANVGAVYNHVEKEGSGGGYYPVGMNTVWHGGIHLRASGNTKVSSCMNGRIVAARLAENESDAYGHYGSRNFILVEHEHKKVKFYSLYAHLKNLPLSKENASIRGVPWLTNAPNSDAIILQLKTGNVVKLDVEVPAGQALWVVGEAGSPKSRATLVHWEIFSETNLFPPSGDGKPAAGGNWIISEDDKDDDYNVDSATILNKFPGSFEKENLSSKELVQFYSTDPKAENMRWVVAKFVSEWGIPDVAAAEKALHDRGLILSAEEFAHKHNLSGSRAERLSKYVWWKEAIAAGVALPQSPHVWHYHPVKFLEAIMNKDSM